MRLSLLVALLLSTGCGHHARHPPVTPPPPEVLITTLLEPVVVIPTVRFRIERVRSYDWFDSYFILEVDTATLTMAGAVKLGIPEAVWIFCATHYPTEEVITIRLVAPANA